MAQLKDEYILEFKTEGLDQFESRVNTALNNLNKTLERLKGKRVQNIVRGIQKPAKDVAKSVEKFGGAMDKAVQSQENFGKGGKKVSDAMEEQAKTSTKAADQITLSWKTVARFIQGAIVLRTINRIRAEITRSIDDAIELSRKISEVQTISLADYGPVRDERAIVSDLRRISDELGVTQFDLIEASYQAISNQVEGAAESFEFLETAAQFSKVAVTSTANSVKLLSSAIHAFNLTTADADRIAAQMFKTVELGRLRAEDLADDYGRTAVMASQLGAQLSELNAMMTVATTQGIKFQNAQTYITNILLRMIRPTTEMAKVYRQMGVESAEMAVQTFGLAGAMGRITAAATESTDAMGKLGDIFGTIRAITGATIFADDYNMKRFIENIREIENAEVDYLRALELRMENTGERLRIEMQRMRNFFLESFGTEAIQALARLTGGIDGLGKRLIDLGLIFGTLTTALYAVKIGANAYTTAMVQLTAAKTAATVAAKALATATAYATGGLSLIAAAVLTGISVYLGYLSASKDVVISMEDIKQAGKEVNAAFIDMANTMRIFRTRELNDMALSFRLLRQTLLSAFADVNSALAATITRMSKVLDQLRAETEHITTIMDLRIRSVNRMWQTHSRELDNVVSAYQRLGREFDRYMGPVEDFREAEEDRARKMARHLPADVREPFMEAQGRRADEILRPQTLQSQLQKAQEGLRRGLSEIFTDQLANQIEELFRHSPQEAIKVQENLARATSTLQQAYQEQLRVIQAYNARLIDREQLEKHLGRIEGARNDTLQEQTRRVNDILALNRQQAQQAREQAGATSQLMQSIQGFDKALEDDDPFDILTAQRDVAVALETMSHTYGTQAENVMQSMGHAMIRELENQLQDVEQDYNKYLEKAKAAEDDIMRKRYQSQADAFSRAMDRISTDIDGYVEALGHSGGFVIGLTETLSENARQYRENIERAKALSNAFQDIDEINTNLIHSTEEFYSGLANMASAISGLAVQDPEDLLRAVGLNFSRAPHIYTEAQAQQMFTGQERQKPLREWFQQIVDLDQEMRLATVSLSDPAEIEKHLKEWAPKIEGLLEEGLEAILGYDYKDQVRRLSKAITEDLDREMDKELSVEHKGHLRQASQAIGRAFDSILEDSLSPAELSGRLKYIEALTRGLSDQSEAVGKLGTEIEKIGVSGGAGVFNTLHELVKNLENIQKHGPTAVNFRENMEAQFGSFQNMLTELRSAAEMSDRPQELLDSLGELAEATNFTDFMNILSQKPEEFLKNLQEAAGLAMITDEGQKAIVGRLSNMVQSSENMVVLLKEQLDVMREDNGTGFSRGGAVSTDSVRARLTPGEYVLNRDAVRNIGVRNLDAMNQGSVQQSNSITINGANDPQATAREVVAHLRSWQRRGVHA